LLERHGLTGVIGSSLAVALAELIENNLHLTSLGLEWNSIGMADAGMQRLCQVRRAVLQNQK